MNTAIGNPLSGINQGYAQQQSAASLSGYFEAPILTVDHAIARHKRLGDNPYADRSIPLLIAEVERLRAMLPKPTPAYHWLGADAE